jgi:hypothetical protein
LPHVRKGELAAKSLLLLLRRFASILLQQQAGLPSERTSLGDEFPQDFRSQKLANGLELDKCPKHSNRPADVVAGLLL